VIVHHLKSIKKEGRRKKEEGRRKKEEGRRKKAEVKKLEGRKSMVWAINNVNHRRSCYISFVFSVPLWLYDWEKLLIGYFWGKTRSRVGAIPPWLPRLIRG